MPARTHRPLRTLSALAAAVLLLAACDGGGGPTDIATPLTVTATGRMERGSTITLSVSSPEGVLAPTAYALSARPADAVQIIDNATIRLLRAGPVSITATAPRLVGTAELTIAAPPVVLFDRVVGGNRDIWRVDLDGQNLAQLTTDQGDDQDPTAAQGTVVFVSYRNGQGDLYSVPLAGGANTRLTATASDEIAPALSPDGQKLAFAYLQGDVPKLYLASANGTNAQRAVPPTGPDFAIETTPSWGPAGALAFVATNNGTADIFELVGSSAPSLLAGGGNTAEVEPALSADGQTLAFVSNRTGTVEIFLLRISTGVVTQLSSGPGSKSQPAWTPDGRVVYVETVSGTARLRWVDPANPGTLNPIDTGAGLVGHPAATAAP